jgi:hypothetical protein
MARGFAEIRKVTWGDERNRFLKIGGFQAKLELRAPKTAFAVQLPG